jgi:hypothetical protein
MKHALSFLALAASTFFALPSRASEAGEEKRAPRAEVVLDTVFGLTGEQRSTRVVDTIVRSFLLEGRVALGRNLDVKLFVPFTHASVRIDGDSQTRSSLGNLGVGLQRRVALGSDVALTLGAILTVPTASGDPASTDLDQAEKAGLAEFSNRIRLFEQDEFYTPRRFGVTPRIDLVALEEGWAYGGYLKVPLLIRAGGEDFPAYYTSAKLNELAVEGVLSGHVLRQFGDMESTEGLAAAIGPRVFLVQIFREPFEDSAGFDQSKTQLGFEFLGRLRFGHVLANLGVLVPLKGRANEAYSKQHSFRFAIGAAF